MEGTKGKKVTAKTVSLQKRLPSKTEWKGIRGRLIQVDNILGERRNAKTVLSD